MGAGGRRRERSQRAASREAPTAARREEFTELLCRPVRRPEAPRKAILTVRAVYFAQAMTGEFAAAWMPSVFVPLVGILGPAVAMALLFNVIEATE
jgi:photosystem I subunit 8